MTETKKGKGPVHKLKKMLGIGSSSAADQPQLGKGSGSKQEVEKAAMAEIGRRSALVKNSTNPSNASRKSANSDLLGEVTDDFHRLKEQNEKKSVGGEKKGEVWD